MPNPLFRPPKHLIKEWPEIFEDLYMNTMPVAYLEDIHLEFQNGRIWKIDVKEQLNDDDAETVADKLLDILQEYKEEIQKIDFKIDVKRLKKDIINSTNNLF